MSARPALRATPPCWQPATVKMVAYFLPTLAISLRRSSWSFMTTAA